MSVLRVPNRTCCGDPRIRYTHCRVVYETVPLSANFAARLRGCVISRQHDTMSDVESCRLVPLSFVSACRTRVCISAPRKRASSNLNLTQVHTYPSVRHAAHEQHVTFEKSQYDTTHVIHVLRASSAIFLYFFCCSGVGVQTLI